MNISHAQLEKIKLLSDLVWERRASYSSVARWIEGISHNIPLDETGISNLLYALEHFIFFNSTLMSSLVNSLYRDIYQYEIIHKIRKENNDTLDEFFIENQLRKELLKTRFIGVGTASESGPTLLYSFRTKNNLGTDLFLDVNQILKNDSLNNDTKKPELQDENILRYVFIDDFCGTGDQGSKYLEPIAKKIKDANSGVYISYICLVATEEGITTFKNEAPSVDTIKAVVILDKTFKAFDEHSRYYKNMPPNYFTNVCKTSMYDLCTLFGSLVNLHSSRWYGYGNCQLLLGFSHNTPDNTLPIFWLANPNKGLAPIFRRYDKKYAE